MAGRLVLALALVAACSKPHAATTPREVPTPSVQVGACGEPGRDGVMGAQPHTDRADRDLDGDGTPESIVVDRGMCTGEGNCYWNVFKAPPPGTQECARYAG